MGGRSVQTNGSDPAVALGGAGAQSGVDASESSGSIAHPAKDASKFNPSELLEYSVRPGVEVINGKRLKGDERTVTMSRHAAQHLVRIEQIAEKGSEPDSWKRFAVSDEGNHRKSADR